MKRFLLCASLLSACGGTPTATKPAADKLVAGLAPKRLTQDSRIDEMDKQIATYFDGHGTRRTYILTDKPLYQPGETIWLRADLRQTKSLVAADAWAAGTGLTLQLVSPRGAIVATKRIQAKDGVGANSF